MSRRRGLLAAALIVTSGSAAADPQSAMVANSQDNSFLIQEAYTQDEGVVQTYLTAELDGGGGDTRSWELDLSQDWPLFSSDHQLTVTLPVEIVEGDSDAAGLGDVGLTYVYQLLHESERLPAIAPALGLSLPTGKESDGFGDGALGYAFRLPVSKVVSDRLQLNWNAGVSYVHTQGADLDDYSVGASAIFALTPDFDLLLEWVGSSDQSVEDGRSDREFVSQISPGARYALDVAGGQLVLGLAAPTGVTADSPDWGVLFYLSFERRFWK